MTNSTGCQGLQLTYELTAADARTPKHEKIHADVTCHNRGKRRAEANADQANPLAATLFTCELDDLRDISFPALQAIRSHAIARRIAHPVVIESKSGYAMQRELVREMPYRTVTMRVFIANRAAYNGDAVVPQRVFARVVPSEKMVLPRRYVNRFAEDSGRHARVPCRLQQGLTILHRETFHFAQRTHLLNPRGSVH